jgi:hypothetical protein
MNKYICEGCELPFDFIDLEYCEDAGIYLCPDCHRKHHEAIEEDRMQGIDRYRSYGPDHA